MASYLVLTSPGAGKADEKARFVADGFSWLGFAVPAIWLLVKRQWLAGIAVAVFQGFAGYLTAGPRFMLAGLLVELALRMLVALEGPAFIARRLEKAGWTLRSIIAADDLETAEIIYDHDTAYQTAQSEAGWTAPALPAAAAKPADGRTGFGLFENYGER